MNAKKEPTLSAIAFTIILAVFLALGFVAGRYSVVLPIDRYMQKASRAATLGNLLDAEDYPAEEKQRIAATYHEPDQALANMDRFSWGVPNVPTPFVGNGPMPGQQGNAFINALQFRAATELTLPKPTGTYRIFITGGSTAFSSGAPSEDRTIGGYLGQLLAQEVTPATGLEYEVFALANPAWASTHERIMIENRLSELEPDMIISLSGNNDVHWGQRGLNVLWLRTYADDYFLRLLNRVHDITGRPELPNVVPVESAEIAPAIVSSRLLKNVRITVSALAQKAIHYVFMLQPTLAVTGKALTAGERAILDEKKQAAANHEQYFRHCYEAIDAALTGFSAVSYRYANLSAIFDGASADEELFIDSYHFGDKGNEIIARSMLDHIREMVSD